MPKPTMRGSGTLALATVLIVSLAGCATANQSEAAAVTTEITDEDVTLSFVYYDDPPATDLIEAFTALHPNVTIDTEQIPFSDYVTSIKLTLNSSEAPDLAQYNAAAMRPLIKAGLIQNLDEWSEAYGWNTKFPESNLRMLTSDDDATTYGEGSLYAVPAGTKFVGLYYNAEILAEAGVEVPETIDELDTALAAVTNAGYRGLSVGGLETGIVHLWSAIQNAFQDSDDYEAWVFGQDGATIETLGAVEATDLLGDWARNQYIGAGASAVSDSDALAEFVAGKSGFIMTGNWAASGVADGVGDAAGFVAAPVLEADSARIATAGSVAYAISSKSENANVAAAFLDFLSSQEASQIQLDSGLMPVGVGADVTAKGFPSEILAAYQEVIDGQGVVAFPDFATTGMLDVLKSGLQAVIADQMSGDEFVASLQKEWDSVHG